MSKHPTPGSEDPFVCAQKQYLIGRFVVSLDQISNHPNQRLLSAAWVDELKTCFQEGADKVAHPIKVVLDQACDWERLARAGRRDKIVPLPPNIRVFVFDGQHRIEAYRFVAQGNEKWWYADVYNPGERILIMVRNESLIVLIDSF
jgi:hypothetical protein